MAKPKHGRWNNYARQSYLSPLDPLPNPHLRSHSQHSRVPSSPRFPSPAVLSALAVIATTPPVVSGSPLPCSTAPPSFLCPFIERDNIDPSSDIFVPPAPCTTVPSSSTPSSTPTPLAQYPKRQVIADRYVEGSDSLWRKTDAWTLYGSICCSSSSTASTSGLQSQPNSSQTPIPTSTSTSTTAAFDTSALPAGWNDATKPSSNTESTIILALAIVLAGCICVFMIGCLVWRRRKKRARDIERKFGHKHNPDDDSQDNVREKDAWGKMRMWARASARWKSNIRQSARRRRKRPLGSPTFNRPPSPTFSDSCVSVITPPIPSRRGSFVAEELDPSTSEAGLSRNDGLTGPPDVQRESPRSVSPPTYGASLVSRFSRLSPRSAVSNPSSTPPPDHSAQRSVQPSFIEDEPLPYIPRSDGHVATDDKAQLARIREMASSPPITLDAASASTMQPVSAPDWHEVEDDLGNMGVDLSEVPSFHNFGLPPTFPPPPSKADIPLGYLDDHPLRYGEGDDILVPFSIPGPLESSFGASPSAPPVDYPGLEPSAPSLEGEDDLFQGWDGAASFVPEVPTSADQDSTPVGVIESFIPPTVSAMPHASSPPARGSAARDSILPQYHP